MMNKSRKFVRILALMLALATIVPAAPALAESYMAITASKPVKAYKDSKLKEKIGEIPAFTLVTVKAVKGDVAQIKVDGAKSVVYADVDRLIDVEDIAIPARVNKSTRVYEQPDLYSRSASLKKGTKLDVLGVNGDWAMVEKDGNLGYTYAEYLTAEGSADDEEDDPFLPEEDEDDGIIIHNVPAETTKKLPVYKSASTSSKKLGTLKKGAVVTLVASKSDINWAYIELDGKYGFCKLNGLKLVDIEVEAPEDDEPALDGTEIAATVTAASVKVYAKADTDSDSLGTLRKGAEVNVVSYEGDWAYIEYNGKFGYCALDALTRTSELTPEDSDQNNGEVIEDKKPLGTATVVVASAPLYDSMNTSASSSTLKLGDTVSYYGYDSKWVLIGKDGQFGFMLRKDLSAESYAELEAEDSGAAVKDLEIALLALGYLDTVPASNYTAKTSAAVKRLQAACGMEETGEASIGLLRVLYSDNAPTSPLLGMSLSNGAKNDNVTRLQTRLHALGYLSRSSSIDGDYGNTTAAAIRLFQKAADLTASGAADNATIRALYSASAPMLASGSNAADASTGSTGGSSSNSTDMNGNLSSNVTEYVQGMSNAKKLEYVIYVAQQQLGKKYVFGSAGTKTFDCSGLTMYCFKQIGVSLPHSAYSQGYNDSRQKISGTSGLRRGDLVFFNTMSDSDQCDHVGIYLGDNYFIHASSGAAKVVVSNLGSGYYNRVYSWGRRVLNA